MNTLRGFLDVDTGVEGSIVSIGNFDGVHRGHQAVIGNAVAAARQQRLQSIVCTFDPHTRAFLQPASPPRLLATLEQRLEAIARLGADITVVIPFGEQVASLPPRQFVERFLCGALGARGVHVSEDFRFGRAAAGDVEFLRRSGREHGFEVVVAPPVQVGGAAVSSTRIRNSVEQGRMREAAALLGRPFTLFGTVVHGDGRGRRLRTPTANLDVADRFLPARGVYVTEARTGGAVHPSVTNVGVRPTFGGSQVSIETHLLEGGGDLYGASVALGFLHRLRAEMRFDGSAELAAQIGRDIAAAAEFFAS